MPLPFFITLALSDLITSEGTPYAQAHRLSESARHVALTHTQRALRAAP